MARAQARRGRRTVKADLGKIGALLRDAGFVGTEIDPAGVTATRDAGGDVRRVHARYPGGWSCTLLRSRDGSYSLSQCWRIRVAGCPGDAGRVTEQRRGDTT